jgi:hypothetical protein
LARGTSIKLWNEFAQSIVVRIPLHMSISDFLKMLNAQSTPAAELSLDAASQADITRGAIA